MEAAASRMQQCWDGEIHGTWQPRTAVKGRLTHSYGGRGKTAGANDRRIRAAFSAGLCNVSKNVSVAAVLTPQCFRSAELYGWKPERRGTMRVEHATRAHLCAAMATKNASRIAFVGDSTTRSMVGLGGLLLHPWSTASATKETWGNNVAAESISHLH